MWQHFEANNYSGMIIAPESWVILPFSWPPENVKETIKPNYEVLGQPGARHKYPVFTEMSEKRLTFDLFFDESIKIPVPSFDNMDSTILGIFGGSMKPAIKGAYALGMTFVGSCIATLELLKTPKSVTPELFSNLAGSVTKIKTTSKSGPPLALLMIGPLVSANTKAHVGYFDDIDINVLQYDKDMLPIRAEAKCSFIVMPDEIFTVWTDATRLLNAAGRLLYGV